MDEYTYEFITDAYNYHPIYEQRENEGYYVKNWQGQGITANQKTYDKTHETNHDHHIRTDLTDEEKNRVYSIIIGMIDKFKGDEKNKQSIKYKLNHSNIIRPSKDGIKEIQKGRYLDIFRRTPEDTVLLRAEYYFDGTNWCEVNIKDLKCNRKIDYSSASKTINIPANQIIYLMLSDIEQSPQRLEALRMKLEKQTPKDWAVVNDFMNNPTKIFTPIVETKQEPYFTVSKGAIYDNRLRALEYPKINIDLKNKLEKNPCMVGYENIIYEDNYTPTLIVPDFAEYAEILYSQIEKLYDSYKQKIGEFGIQDQIHEELAKEQEEKLKIKFEESRIKRDEAIKTVKMAKNILTEAQKKLSYASSHPYGNNSKKELQLAKDNCSSAESELKKVENLKTKADENYKLAEKEAKEAEKKRISIEKQRCRNKLKHLSELICSEYDNWDLLNEEDREHLKQDFYNKKYKLLLVEYLSKKLAWWICQSCYQDMIYDYEFYYNYSKNNKEEYEEYITDRFLKYIEIIYDFNQEAMNYLCSNALKLLKTMFIKKLKSKSNNYDLAFIDYLCLDIDMHQKDEDILADLDKFESYKEFGSYNWFVECLYPNVISPSKDIITKLLGYFAKSIVYCVHPHNTKDVVSLEKLFYKLFRNFNKQGLITISRLTKDEKAIKISSKSFKNIYFLKSNVKEKDGHAISFGGRISAINHFVSFCNIIIAIDAIESADSTIEKCSAYLQVTSLLCDSIQNIFKKEIYGYISAGMNLCKGICDFMNLYGKGDKSAAKYKLSVSVVSLFVVIVPSVFVSIPLLLIAIGLDLYGSKKITVDIEKWVRYCEYGIYYNDLMKNKKALGWSDFERNVLEEDFIKEIPENKTKEDYIYETWRDDLSFRIDTYEKIIHSFSVKCTPLQQILYSYHWNPNMPIDAQIKDEVLNFSILRMELNFKTITINDRFKISIELKNTINNKNMSTQFEGDGTNLNCYYDESEGYKIVLYLLSDNNEETLRYIKEKSIKKFNDFKNPLNDYDIKTIVKPDFMNIFKNNILSSFNSKQNQKYYLGEWWFLKIHICYYQNAGNTALNKLIPTKKLEYIEPMKTLRSRWEK